MITYNDNNQFIRIIPLFYLSITSVAFNSDSLWMALILTSLHTWGTHESIFIIVIKYERIIYHQQGIGIIYFIENEYENESWKIFYALNATNKEKLWLLVTSSKD
jgi:hypothetical protein